MAVTNNATLIEDHESAPSYSSIGGGQGAGSESNFFFRGVLSSSRKMSGVTKSGFWFSDGTQHNVSAAGTHYKVYINAITQASFTDFWIRIGPSQSVYEEHNPGVDFYDNEAGGWIPVWVEVGSGTNTGSPTFTAVDEWAVICSMGSISGNVKNFITDQSHYSTRPVLLWDGASGDLDDFITTESTAGVGALKLLNGLYTCFANFKIGSATSTTFDMSGKTIAFPDATWLPSASTWMGIDIDLQHASTNITATGGSIISGNPSGASARKPDYIVTGNAGDHDISNRAFDGMRLITLTSGVTGNNCSISNSGVVTLGEADLKGTSILVSAVAADEGAIFDDRDISTPTSIAELDNTTFSQGPNAHHAIRFGVNVDEDITLTSIEFTGFSSTSDADGATLRFDATSGSINVNLIGCTVDGSPATTGNIGVDDAAGVVVTLVVDPVTETVNVKNESGDNIENARVLIETAATIASGEMFEASVSTLTQISGTATCTMTADHGLVTGDYVVVRGAQPDGYNKVAQVTVSSSTVFTYSVNSGLSSTATGTVVVSFVAIIGLTNASGNISATRTWGAAQAMKGWARQKNTTSPFYKDADIAYNINTSSGNTVNVTLLNDE